MSKEFDFPEKSMGSITPDMVNLTPAFIDRCRTYIAQIADTTSYLAAHQSLFAQSFLRLFFSNLSSERLGIDKMSLRPPELFPEGSVVRLDALIGQDQPPRICDLNTSLTGYAVHRQAFEQLTSETDVDPVTLILAGLLSGSLDNVILTNSEYPANPHLKWVATRTSSYTNSALRLDYPAPNYDHRREDVGCLIQQCREPWILHQSGTHIYPPGSKFAELKLLPYILAKIMPNKNSSIMTRLAVPSLPVFFSDGENSVTTFHWSDLPGQPTFFYSESVLRQFLRIPQCIVKEIDSSGSKGVFHIKGMDWNDFFTRLKSFGNIYRKKDLKQAKPTNTFYPPSFALIQPVINSRIALGDKSYPAKLDLFFQQRNSQWSFVGAGALITTTNPSQKLVHGGNHSRVVVIPDSWA